MIAHDAAPVGDTTGHGYIDGGATIIHLRPRRLRSCSGCGIRLPADSSAHHTICRTCYAWRAAYVSLRYAVTMLHEVRP